MGGDLLDIDDVLDLLGAERRREVLRILSNRELSLTLADLADEVAVREHRTPIDEISAEDVKRIYLALYHTHVPKLAAGGVVDYDQEQDMVSPTENFRHVAPYLEVLDRADTRADEDPCTE